MRVALALLAAAGCMAAASFGCRGPATDDIQLVFRGECEQAELELITDLSVNVYGFIPGGEQCVLGKRCIPRVPKLTSVADIEAILRDEQQPLLDVERSDAALIEVIGHARSCLSNDDYVMCGKGDLQAASMRGDLSITMGCGNCSADATEFCP